MHFFKKYFLFTRVALVDVEETFRAKHVVPLHYHLSLNVQALSNYTGMVQIQFKVEENMRRVRMNYEGKSLSQVLLKEPASINSKCLPIQASWKHSKVWISLKDSTYCYFQRGENYTLQIEFGGDIHQNRTSGFYWSPVSENDNGMALTQFESKYARSVYPCFDQPHLKARFAIEIKVDESLYVISNAPVESVVNHPEQSSHTFKFQETPPMSTYLSAWVIHSLEHSDLVSKSNRTISMYYQAGDFQKVR
jgi:aminopeptidase N